MVSRSRAVGPLDYALQQELEVAVESKKEHLAKEGAPDFAEYKSLCGEIRGIRFAIDQIIELRGRLEKQDES